MLLILLFFFSAHAFLFQMHDTINDAFLEYYKKGQDVSGSFFVVKGGKNTIDLTVCHHIQIF